MITALVLASLAGLLALTLPRLTRPMPAVRPEPPADAVQEPCGHPESMTAELDQEDEEFLAWLADCLWPEDEYLDPDHIDGEEETGGNMRR